MSIQTKLTLSLLSLCIGVILAAGFFSTLSLDKYFHDRLVAELTVQANQTEFVLRTLVRPVQSGLSENDTTAYPARTGLFNNDTALYAHLELYARASNLRLPLIDAPGRVIFE